jgi:hypothetical protein
MQTGIPRMFGSTCGLSASGEQMEDHVMKIGKLSTEFAMITAEALTAIAFITFTQNMHFPRFAKMALPAYFSGLYSWISGLHASRFVFGGTANCNVPEVGFCPEKIAGAHPKRNVPVHDL